MLFLSPCLSKPFCAPGKPKERKNFGLNKIVKIKRCLFLLISEAGNVHQHFNRRNHVAKDVYAVIKKVKQSDCNGVSLAQYSRVHYSHSMRNQKAQMPKQRLKGRCHARESGISRAPRSVVKLKLVCGNCRYSKRKLKIPPASSMTACPPGKALISEPRKPKYLILREILRLTPNNPRNQARSRIGGTPNKENVKGKEICTHVISVIVS